MKDVRTVCNAMVKVVLSRFLLTTLDEPTIPAPYVIRQQGENEVENDCRSILVGTNIYVSV